VLKASWFHKWGRPPTTRYFLTLINGGSPLCTIQRLKPICDRLLSSCGFNFNLRRYIKEYVDIIKSCYPEVGRCRLPVSKPELKARPNFSA
jgi:hypothetical protein